MKRIKLVVIGAAMAGVIGMQAISGGVAVAHNAGHVVLPDGTCLNVGSGKAGPFVAENNPHYHDAPDQDQGRLDLIAGPGDQYGARFAATRGNSEVLPAECP
jgi:hypothetical protein